MNKLRRWIRAFFGFSKTETNGMLILLPLMVLIIFSQPMYRWWRAQTPRDFSEEQAELDSLVAVWEKSNQAETSDKPDSLFQFDPNQANRQQLVSLGFPEALAQRVVNYREKGGRFYIKKDLGKIYGMDSVLLAKLYPWIILPEEKAPVVREARLTHVPAKPAFEAFDLNTADTIQLKWIRGIGSKLAQRIVSYREKLGGFHHPSQLYEVYALDSGVVAELSSRSFIKPDAWLKKISVNTATEQQLQAHPYVSKRMAQAIVTWRFQHGNFNSLSELEKIATIRADDLKKVLPYLEL